MDINKASAILSPYNELLRKCINNGFNSFQNLGSTHLFDPSTKASMIRDYIVSDIRKEFSEFDAASFLEKGKSFFLILDNQIFIRFKKFRGPLMTSNYPTERAKRIDSQGLLISTANSAILTAGYRADPAYTHIQDICITKRCGNVNEWVMYLNNNTYEEQTTLPENVVTKTETVIKLKQKSLEEIKDGTNN